ncbi:MAG TPA: TlpA disulfide reductase family protein [Pyrinomonadaceae bacterium]|nr:TlpA disulfide reductase family protein [Pyrinomonadaceae bacterium]
MSRITSPVKILLFFVLTLIAPLTALATPDPDFTFRSLDGQTVTAASLRGKVVVLAIGASWLPLSRAQIQGVQKLADAYANRDVVVFWVSTDSESPKSKNYASDEQLRAFAAKYNLKIKVLRDPDAAVSKQLGVNQVPTVLILTKEGQVAGSPVGGLDPNGNLADQLSARLSKVL